MMRGPPVTFRSMSLTRTDPALILFKNVPKEKLFQIAVSVYQKGLASKKIYIIALKSFFWGIFFPIVCFPGGMNCFSEADICWLNGCMDG